MQMIEKARRTQLSNCKEITSMIWLVFSNPEALNKSFLLPEGEGVAVSKDGKGRNGRVTVDVAAVRRTYDALFNLEVQSIANAFENAMNIYCTTLKQQKAFCQTEPLNHIVLLLENPQLHSPEFMKTSSKLLQVVALLPVQQKEMLIKFYATYSAEQLREFVSNFHQLITMRLLFSEDSPKPHKIYVPQSDPLIASATTTMTVFYFASLLQSGKTRPMSKQMSSIAANPKPQYLQSVESECDQLLMRLQVKCTCHFSWEK